MKQQDSFGCGVCRPITCTNSGKCETEVSAGLDCFDVVVENFVYYQRGSMGLEVR